MDLQMPEMNGLDAMIAIRAAMIGVKRGIIEL
jgi:CheY-like chemotaxis protein